MDWEKRAFYGRFVCFSEVCGGLADVARLTCVRYRRDER